MGDICRICLKSGELITLFHSDDSLKLSDKIMMCTSVQIVDDDGLPSNICLTCVERLNTSYDFKILCESSDLILRKNTKIKVDGDEVFESIKNRTNVSSASDSEKIADISESDKNYLDESNNLERKKKITIKRKRKSKPKVVVDDNLIHNCSKYTPSSIDDDCDDTNSERFNENSFDNESCTVSSLKKAKISNNTLKKHNNKNKSVNKSNKEQCSMCGKVMSSKFRLRMHLRIHTGEKPFTCNYCGKTFALSQNLKVHERVHTGEKPLLCGICGKAFAQSAGLVTHMRLHTGETPYKCSLCPMKYRTPGHLQYHIRQHTGEKNYECSTCHKAFITKGDLTQHAKIHTGEKPYICTICGLRMSRSSHLTRHLMTHTGEKPHRCNTCGSSYAQKGDLARHIKKHPATSCKPLVPHTEVKSNNQQMDCNKIIPNLVIEDRNVIVENKMIPSNNTIVKTLSSNPGDSADLKYEFGFDRANRLLVKKEIVDPDALVSNYN